MEKQKNIFVILGMARSGTSVISKGLETLGINLGNKFARAKHHWNPTGSWEDADIVYKINRKVLPIYNAQINKSAPGRDKKINNLKGLAIEILRKKMHDTNYFAFKDPRTTHILPFWQSVFETLHLKEHYIIAARNPLASAHSYQRVSGKPIEVGLLSWIMHLIAAIDGTNEKKRILVNYDMVINNPVSQLKRIKNYFSIPEFNNENLLHEFEKEYLDKNLHRFSYSLEDLRQHSIANALPLCVMMYELFLKLASDEINFEDYAFSSAWDEIKDEYKKMLPFYRHVEAAQQKNLMLERQLKTIKKSLPWKITYPIRIIDDALRARRRNREFKD